MERGWGKKEDVKETKDNQKSRAGEKRKGPASIIFFFLCRLCALTGEMGKERGK
jgi:hypothetical protein